MSTPIILDCDPGIDDALAIAFAHGLPDIELARHHHRGRQRRRWPRPRRTRWPWRVRRRGRRAGDGRVRRAAAAPGAATRGTCTASRGSAARCCRRRRRAAARGHAIDFIIDTIGAAPGEITLVATGPLTNIALALQARAAAGDLGAGLRDHGRFGVARQRHARRRVQHLGRPGGGGDRLRRGLDGADDRARRHAARPGHRRRPGADARPRPARARAAAARARPVPGLGRRQRASRRCTTCARSCRSPTRRCSGYTPALVQVETHGRAHVGDDGDRLRGGRPGRTRRWPPRSTPGWPCPGRDGALAT